MSRRVRTTGPAVGHTFDRRPLPHQPAAPAFIRTSLRQPRAGLSAGQAVSQMADDMREAAYREGGLTREGLELLGYTKLQIDTLSQAARARANKLAALTA